MRESAYQKGLRTRIEDRFEGCVIIKGPSDEIQGIPDLIIFYKDKWAMLEVKRSANEPFQPNQEYYLELFGSMSYAAVIYPEIEEEVLDDLQRSLFS